MSRNFELLQRVASLRGNAAAGMRSAAVSQTAADTLIESAGTPAAPVRSFGTEVRPEIKELVHRLFLIPGASAPKAVVLCGITATLEANSIALLAAEALCTLGQPSVCLIDAKVASPTFHEVFDLTNKHGLTTALLSDAPIQSFGRRLPNLNLLVIPSGPEIAGWEALLSSGAMATRIDELLQQFTHVLIEAPSIGESQVAVALGRAADGVVLVVEADETRRELAMKAKQELEQSNVRLLGAVLNNRRFPIPQRLYSRL